MREFFVLIVVYRWNCVRRRQRYLDDGEENDEEEQITVPISVCLALMVGYVCGGGVLFSNWENWKFLDASYFCFIRYVEILVVVVAVAGMNPK